MAHVVPKKNSLRLVFVGDAKVNNSQLKTNFLHRLTKQDEKIKSAAPFSTASIDMIVDGFPLEISLVDTAALENNIEELKKSVYPNADGFVLVFSLADPKSLQSIGEKVHAATFKKKQLDKISLCYFYSGFLQLEIRKMQRGNPSLLPRQLRT